MDSLLMQGSSDPLGGEEETSSTEVRQLNPDGQG